jgi:hypothetical protein
MFLGSLAAVFAKEYYVSTNGSIANSGLSINAPWSLGKLSYNANIPSNSTITVLPGVYNETNAQNTREGPGICSPYLTIKSQVKWGAILQNSMDDGLAALTNNVTIDGFVIRNAYNNGVFGSTSNLAVRNCWISYCGTNPASGEGPSGISDEPRANNTLIENNLIEHIGNTTRSNFDHGLYIAGRNLTIRNNIIRYCVGAGIQLNDQLQGGNGSTNVLIYNNLIYNNGQWGMYLSSGQSNSVSTTLLNNTVVGSGIALAAGTLLPGITYMNCSNNILIAGVQTLHTSHSYSTNSVINADYNIIAITDNMPLGTHGILANNAMFSNTNNGLYWLQSNSIARGAAFATACGPEDFFGNRQSSVTDMGAFQYSFPYGLDNRVLDPSPALPDYWLDLTQLQAPGNVHEVPGSPR